MTTAARIATAEDLLKLQDGRFRYELVNGEIRKMAPAGSQHGWIAMQIGSLLAEHVRAHRLGRVYAAETGFKLAGNPDTVRAPDVAFVSRARVDAAGDPVGYWPGAPDLAIEVISPSDTYAEVEDKVLDWLAAGSRMVLVVNPQKHTVSVYQARTARVLTESDVLDGGDTVPGWEVPVKRISE